MFMIFMGYYERTRSTRVCSDGFACMQVTLECGAHNTGYCKPDIGSTCPEGECCVEGAEEEASTCLDMEKLLEQVMMVMMMMVIMRVIIMIMMWMIMLP